MKSKAIIYAAVLLFIGISSIDCQSQTTDNDKFTLFELFTSEGCSSCPAAESALSEYVSSKNVYVLEYHVDYWDRLGWKDTFSDPYFSQRQSKYAEKMNLSSVYTPQVVVNGTVEFVGSDRPRLKEASSHPQKSKFEINLTARKIDNKIELSYVTRSTENKNLCIALVQNSSKVNVKKGENSGRTLQHFNIVKSLHILEQPGIHGTTSFDCSKIEDPNNFSIVAFLQDKATNEVVAIKKIGL
jgi:hypothetical protein